MFAKGAWLGKYRVNGKCYRGNQDTPPYCADYMVCDSFQKEGN